MDLLFNKYQTAIDDALIKKLPKQVYSDLIDSIEHIPLINWLIQPSQVRGYAKNRPKHNQLSDEDLRKQYNDSRVVVDVTKPHILEDMDFFRERAIFFDKYGYYTDITPNPNPNSDYALFWKEEVRRWRDGVVRPSDGEWIPGGLYFYWNYCPIWLTEEKEIVVKGRVKTKGDRVRKFPKPWLGDYLFYHYMEQGRENGQHGKLLKARSLGFSFKMGSLSPRNMYVLPGSGNPNFHLASDKGFLTGDKGLFGKVVDTLDWIADHTPLPSLRIVDSARSMEIQLGYDDENGQRRGLLSSVFGISLKDNPDKARGVRGPLIHYEEDGLFPNLEDAWNINRKAVEDGDVAFGYMLAGGCVCAGTEVWTNNGDCVKIENLKQSDGIIGFDVEKEINAKQTISWMQPPTLKECVEIKTISHTIKCSLDHPILVRTKRMYNTDEIIGVRRDYYKKLDKWYESPKHKTVTEYHKEWKLAGDIDVSDVILCSAGIDMWGTYEMFDARLIGMLIGDGSYGMRMHYGKQEYKTPSFSNCDKELVDYVINKYPCNIELQRPTKDGRLYHEISIRGLVQELKNIGIAGQSKTRKRLPQNYRNLTKNDAALMLAGLFDTDGYIQFREKQPSSISITQTTSEILEEIQFLLNKFGIRSRISRTEPGISHNRKDKNPWFTLSIGTKFGMRRFYENIPLLVKYKQDNLELINNKGLDTEVRINNTFENIIEERVCSINRIGLNNIYNLTASENNTYLANGIITHNTGGTTGASFEGSRKLFYSPGTYNIYSVNNVYDKGVNQNNKCGFFWGAYMNRNKCYDISTGEPDVIKALIEIHSDRNVVRSNSTDPNALTQKKAEEPITPQEAIMKTEGNLFPANDLREYLSEIKPNLPNFVASHTVGEFAINQSGVIFKTNENINPIREYPLIDKNNMVGAVELFELPARNGAGNIMNFRYIAGIDPIDDDSSTTNSLPSIFIMDRFTNRIVAEYTGRPKFANDFYEVCARMLLFYNATANYENDKKGLFGYFQQKGLMHLLCNTPTWLKDKQMIRGDNLYGNKAKGTNSGKEVNAAGRRLLKDWMLTTAYGEPEGGLMNLQKIRSIGLIEEAIMWNIDGNFDRISAMGMLMIYKEELYTLDIAGVETKRNKTLDDDFFKRCDKNYNRS